MRACSQQELEKTPRIFLTPFQIWRTFAVEIDESGTVPDRSAIDPNP
jgi:hypothetical protein